MSEFLRALAADTRATSVLLEAAEFPARSGDAHDISTWETDTTSLFGFDMLPPTKAHLATNLFGRPRGAVRCRDSSSTCLAGRVPT
jgi:hypothetical protein